MQTSQARCKIFHSTVFILKSLVSSSVTGRFTYSIELLINKKKTVEIMIW